MPVIDMHAHGQNIPSARIQAFDGVTTGLELEAGILPVGEFYDNCAKEGRPINYGVSAGWAYARVATMNPEKLVNGKPVPNIAFMFGNFGLKEWVENVAEGETLQTVLELTEQGLKEGGIGIGGAYGKGRVFAKGQMTGTASMSQVTVGFQLGGQVFSQVIFFEDKRAYDEFTSGNFEFGAQATAVALTAGASASAGGGAGASAGVSGGQNNASAVGSYRKGMAIYTIAKGGLMYEATLGGQKFSFDAVE